MATDEHGAPAAEARAAADRGAAHRPQDACLLRTADALDFGPPTAAEAAAAAERRVDPLGTLLVGLVRGLRRGRRR